MTQTVVVSVVIPQSIYSAPVATVVFPNGDFHRATLHDHDWVNDWNGWSAPSSLLRHLAIYGYRHAHGSRVAYMSPADVGTEINEQGRLTVFEIDYDS